jgi:biopolymer transport protein TolR
MAVALQSRTSRRGGRRGHRPMSDINVTPMVDVMLVLLIIFMVTAPLLTLGVQVDLPQTRAGAIQGSDEPLTISIRADGQIYLQETALDVGDLGSRLRAITGNNPDVRIFVRGDKAIPYGRVMAVMGSVTEAGYRRVALITEMPEQAKQPATRTRR